MSKIIEALKVQSSAASLEHSAAAIPPIAALHGGPEGLATETRPKEVTVERTGRDLTQQQLAEIYFSATGKPKTSEVPVIIRVIEKSHSASFIPWVITFTAFLITMISLFSSKRIFVDIRWIDEKSPYLRALQHNDEEFVRDAGAKNSASASNVPAANKFSMQDFNFEGAAYLNSSRDRSGGLTLINSSVAPFARATLMFDPPLDLSHAYIVFYAKGGYGGENVAFALKDRENVQGFYKGKIYPFPDRLTSGWQKTEISVSLDTAKDFDAKNVTSLRFEFGSKDTGNKPGDTVFIKDLQWAIR